jgi:hypothetical protein
VNLCTPRDWQRIAQREALDLLGSPEGAIKLAEAARYGSCADRIEGLERALQEALALVESVAEQQAYPDDSYVAPLRVLRENLRCS